MPRPKETVYTHSYDSPIGELHVAVDRRGAVIRVGFEPPVPWNDDVKLESNKYACGELELQLDEYFQGQRRDFTLDLRLSGTDFQRSVWSRLRKLPYGATFTYGEVAQKVGRRGAARAVGNAVALNPICVLIPCHRVVPARGGVGKYGARYSPTEVGSHRKRYLLSLEHQPEQHELAFFTQAAVSA